MYPHGVLSRLSAMWGPRASVLSSGSWSGSAAAAEAQCRRAPVAVVGPSCPSAVAAVQGPERRYIAFKYEICVNLVAVGTQKCVRVFWLSPFWLKPFWLVRSRHGLLDGLACWGPHARGLSADALRQSHVRLRAGVPTLQAAPPPKSLKAGVMALDLWAHV